MKLLKHIASLWKSIPIEEKGDRRTRWLLTLLSFLLLAVLMTASFVAAMCSNEVIALALIDLTKHLSYVFGAVVGSYFAIESIWPSSDRPFYWGGNTTNVFRRKGEDQEPPVSPDHNDAQVD